MALALAGISVSKGIAIGTVYTSYKCELDTPEYTIPSYMTQAEVARFLFALEIATQRLKAIRDHIPPNTPPDIVAFIDAHLLMINDPTLKEGPIRIIKNEHRNAEWALKIQRDAIVSIFEEMDDPYLRTRKDDVDHVIEQIHRILRNQTGEHHIIGDRLKGQIIVTDDLSPADTVLLQHHQIAAIVSEQGGPTSHTAILARSLGIPAVVGVQHARRYLKNNEQIIVDGLGNVIIANPDDKILSYYRVKQKELKRYHASLQDLKPEPAKTLDGKNIALQANIELPEDLLTIKKVSASGIGLFRTEFLFMNRVELPDENEQFRAYNRVVKYLKGAPVTIRTMDLGAEKQWENPDMDIPGVKNTALGLRGIRLCLKEPSLFKPQLRAILRTSAYGKVRLMIPMLSNINELFQVLELLEDAKQDLKKRHVKYDNHMPVGCMVETPAAALIAYSIAKQVDFLSIGTNDLIQYTLAIDRIDNEVSHLYDPLHPAVLNLIQMTILAGKKAGIPVSLCGEMAGDTRYTRLLLGMGLTEFSMHPSTLLEVKQLIQNSDTNKLNRVIKKILKCSSSNEVSVYLDKMNNLD